MRMKNPRNCRPVVETINISVRSDFSSQCWYFNFLQNANLYRCSDVLAGAVFRFAYWRESLNTSLSVFIKENQNVINEDKIWTDRNAEFPPHISILQVDGRDEFGGRAPGVGADAATFVHDSSNNGTGRKEGVQWIMLVLRTEISHFSLQLSIF